MSRNAKIFVSLLGVIVFIFGVSGAVKPQTLQVKHMVEVARQSVPVGLTTLGQAAVILSGGIDLSVGEIITMTNVVATDMMRGDPSTTVPVITLLLVLGGLIGATNGFIIAKTNMSPLVMTFAMSSIIKGGYLLYSGGAPKGRVSPFLRWLGSGRLWGVPVSLWFYLIVIGGVVFLFRKTRWGRSVFYMGNNPTAAVFSGVPRTLRLVVLYAFCSICAVLAGLVLSGYIGVANFDIGGNAYMLDSIVGAVLAGITFNGLGAIGAAALGALIVTELNSVLTFMGIPHTSKLIVRGTIIIAMVAMYMGKVNLRALLTPLRGEQTREPG